MACPATGRAARCRCACWPAPALTVVLLVASAVVIFLRLHHPAFGVTGAAITQVTGGCTVDVTGRISTTGGAGSSPMSGRSSRS